MEVDHQRDREPCLSPAAFVNQVQYSNILEGRFKQLQGKSYTHQDLYYTPGLFSLKTWNRKWREDLAYDVLDMSKKNVFPALV